MNRKSKPPFRCSLLSIIVACLSLVSFSVVAQEIDYTCDPNRDYGNPKAPDSCPEELIQNGICDNPNHGGLEESCRGEDCIDCNFYCGQFQADCSGCLNAKGCYWCPGDATCQNSNLYQSAEKNLLCKVPGDFWLGGRDDPDELCLAPDSLTQDPLSSTNNWLYKMINIDKVWQDGLFTGAGVSIRINDLGVDPTNPDFDGRFDQANSCERFEPSLKTDGSIDSRGTRVAGILLGNANNDICAAGIAYGATFTSCNVEDFNPSMLKIKLESVDISHISIESPPCVDDAAIVAGPVETIIGCPFNAPRNRFNDPCDANKCDFANQATAGLSFECENAIVEHCKLNFRDDESACLDFIDILLDGKSCDYNRLDKQTIDALAEGVTEGRNGKGIIYVFSSGNDFHTGGDVNFSRWPNSRYTITVGAVGKDGLHSAYSTPGAALTLVAPSGDVDDASNILTTGLGNSCTDSGLGTQLASPVVSGVIALMLEARPELTWRDVQGILAVTSTAKDDSKDTTKTTNKAGFTHSYWYGFGIVDAKKAVDKAQTWTLWTPEYQAIGESAEENQPIPNDGTEYISELTMSEDYKGFTAESTAVMLNLQHYNRGDLELTLVSPDGTESVLHPGRRAESKQITGDERWKLMTVRNWGEDPTGKWQLKIKDLETDNTVANGANELRQWKIVVYGRTVDGLPPVLSSPAPSGAPSLAVSTGTPSQIPSDQPVQADATPAPTQTPTTSPPTSPPTHTPTLTPGRRTLPPLLVLRPTVLVRGSNPVPDTNIISNRNPIPVRQATLPKTAPIKLPVANPGLKDALGGKVVRPVIIVGQDPAITQGDATFNLVSPFTRFGEDEPEEGINAEVLLVKLVQNISLVLEGVAEEIPETFWKSIQTALEEHTMGVIEKQIPGLNLRSEILLTSVTVDEPAPNRQRRNLRPNLPTATIVFDELFHFDRAPGTENLKGMDLAALPFQDSKHRDAFVENIRNQLDDNDHPWLGSLVGVSPLVLPPSEDEVPEQTPAVLSSENNTQETSGDDTSDVFDPAMKNIIIVSSVGVGLLCVTLLFVLRRRRVDGK